MSYQQQLKEHYKAVRERLRMGPAKAAIVPAKALLPPPKTLSELLAEPQQKSTEPSCKPGLLSEKQEQEIVKQALSVTAMPKYEPFMGGRTRAQAERFEDELRLSPKLPPLPGLDLEEQGGIRWMKVLRAVAKHHNISPDDIMGRSRRKDIISARFEVFYRLRVDVRLSYEKIAILMKRDHTSVMHAVYKVRNRLLDERSQKRKDKRPTPAIHPMA